MINESLVTVFHSHLRHIEQAVSESNNALKSHGMHSFHYILTSRFVRTD